MIDANEANAKTRKNKDGVHYAIKYISNKIDEAISDSMFDITIDSIEFPFAHISENNIEMIIDIVKDYGYKVIYTVLDNRSIIKISWKL